MFLWDPVSILELEFNFDDSMATKSVLNWWRLV